MNEDPMKWDDPRCATDAPVGMTAGEAFAYRCGYEAAVLRYQLENEILA